MGIARALGNLIGNCVATVVVAAWEKDIDRAVAHRVLNGEVAIDLDEHVEPAGLPEVARTGAAVNA